MSVERKNNLYKHFTELFPMKNYQPIIKRAINNHMDISKQYDPDELHDLINNYIISWSHRNRIDSLLFCGYEY